MKKKIAILCLIILVITTITVQASDLEPPAGPEVPEEYVGMSSISASLTINSSGSAHCAGSAVAKSGYSLSARLYLIRQAGPDETVVSWSGNGSTILIDQSYTVTSGYYYYTKLVVDVKNSSNVVVATYDAYSPAQYY